MIEDPNVQLTKIKTRLSALLAQYKALQHENETLRSLNGQLKNTLDERDKKIEEIQNKNINLQLSRALGISGAGETDLRQRLDEYIKEIDAAIAHLKD